MCLRCGFVIEIDCNFKLISKEAKFVYSSFHSKFGRIIENVDIMKEVSG